MAEFRISVTVDPTGARRGAQQVEGALNRTGRQADRLRGLLARAFGALGTGLVIRSAIRTMASFSQAMSTVQAVSGASAAQLNRLRESARQLGATTRFTATQAAEGMLFLARAGFDTNEVLESITGTLQLAQAGALELGRAADIASNVLQGFRLSTDETGRVVDVLAATANNANTNVEQLGNALSFVAPVAASLGVRVETAAAAIGVLSNQGIQATRAGTGLNRILAELQVPTEATIKVFERLGVATEQVRISQVGLVQALRVLRDAAGGAGSLEGIGFELFGQRGGPAFEALAAFIGQIEELEGTLDMAGGTAARVSDVMDDNLNGAILRTRSAWESLILAFGELGPESALVQFFNGLADAIRGVADNLESVLGLAARIGVGTAAGAVLGGLPGAIAGAGGVAAFEILRGLGGGEGPANEPVGPDPVHDALLDAITVVGRRPEDPQVYEAPIGPEQIMLTEDQAAAFDRLRSSLDPLGEAEREVTRAQALLTQAQEAGIITSGQSAELQLALARAYRDELDPLSALHRELGQAERLRSVSVNQRRSEISLQREVARLTERGLVLQDDEIEGLRVAIRERDEHRRALRLEHQIYRSLEDPVQRYADQLDALANVIALHPELAGEAQQAHEMLRLQFLRTQEDFASGFERGLIRIGQQFRDFASLAERAVTSWAKAAEDTLVEFVRTGKLQFSNLIDSILADLARLAVRKFITGPIASALGLGGGIGGLGGGLGGIAGVAGSALGGLGGIGSSIAGALGIGGAAAGIPAGAFGAGIGASGAAAAGGIAAAGTSVASALGSVGSSIVSGLSSVASALGPIGLGLGGALAIGSALGFGGSSRNTERARSGINALVASLPASFRDRDDFGELQGILTRDSRADARLGALRNYISGTGFSQDQLAGLTATQGQAFDVLPYIQSGGRLQPNEAFAEAVLRLNRSFDTVLNSVEMISTDAAGVAEAAAKAAEMAANAADEARSAAGLARAAAASRTRIGAAGVALGDEQTAETLNNILAELRSTREQSEVFHDEDRTADDSARFEPTSAAA